MLLIVDFLHCKFSIPLLQILCASAITPVLFLEECKDALLLPKESQTPGGKDELSRSMVWICTGNENLTKVHARVHTNVCTSIMHKLTLELLIKPQ